MTMSPTTRAATAAGLAVLFVLIVVVGCSKSAVPAKTEAGADRGTSAASVVAASVCDRHILNVEDLAGILSPPITGTRPLPGDAQSCEFVTASFPAIIVSVRPGLGRTTVDAWVTGKMPLDSVPLAGVGDSAVWLETLHEVVAQRNALLCDIQVRGGGSDLEVNSKTLQGTLGALCNKIFEAF
jgi:hypothetical protein